MVLPIGFDVRPVVVTDEVVGVFRQVSWPGGRKDAFVFNVWAPSIRMVLTTEDKDVLFRFRPEGAGISRLRASLPHEVAPITPERHWQMLAPAAADGSRIGRFPKSTKEGIARLESVLRSTTEAFVGTNGGSAEAVTILSPLSSSLGQNVAPYRVSALVRRIKNDELVPVTLEQLRALTSDDTDLRMAVEADLPKGFVQALEADDIQLAIEVGASLQSVQEQSSPQRTF